MSSLQAIGSWSPFMGSGVDRNSFASEDAVMYILVVGFQCVSCRSAKSRGKIKLDISQNQIRPCTDLEGVGVVGGIRTTPHRKIQT